MASVDQSLDAAININEAFAAALVDYESGMMLGSRGGSPEFDMEVAAPGNSEVVRTELEVMQKLVCAKRSTTSSSPWRRSTT